MIQNYNVFSSLYVVFFSWGVAMCPGGVDSQTTCVPNRSA